MDRERQKLLVVTDVNLSPRVAEYAIRVAVRLDLDVLLLFVNDPPSVPANGSPGENPAGFRVRAENAATEFTALARKSSVRVTSIIDLATRDEAIARTRKEEENIRFILSGIPGNQPGTDGDNDGSHPHLEVIRSG